MPFFRKEGSIVVLKMWNNIQCGGCLIGIGTVVGGITVKQLCYPFIFKERLVRFGLCSKRINLAKTEY
jgi:hypothetical protein